ncbi:hypothetical protein DWV63_12195 [Enterococcus durans]|nr:hypothetical protein DWV63_12195 [Enterococcus durans]
MGIIYILLRKIGTNIENRRAYETNLKIRFTTDFRINGGSRSNSFGNFKKNEQYKKRIVRFSLQFLKPKRVSISLK